MARPSGRGGAVRYGVVTGAQTPLRPPQSVRRTRRWDDRRNLSRSVRCGCWHGERRRGPGRDDSRGPLSFSLGRSLRSLSVASPAAPSRFRRRLPVARSTTLLAPASVSTSGRLRLPFRSLLPGARPPLRVPPGPHGPAPHASPASSVALRVAPDDRLPRAPSRARRALAGARRRTPRIDRSFVPAERRCEESVMSPPARGIAAPAGRRLRQVGGDVGLGDDPDGLAAVGNHDGLVVVEEVPHLVHGRVRRDRGK